MTRHADPWAPTLGGCATALTIRADGRIHGLVEATILATAAEEPTSVVITHSATTGSKSAILHAPDEWTMRDAKRWATATMFAVCEEPRHATRITITRRTSARALEACRKAGFRPGGHIINLLVAGPKRDGGWTVAKELDGEPDVRSTQPMHSGGTA